jgi:hypothetical protein
MATSDSNQPEFDKEKLQEMMRQSQAALDSGDYKKGLMIFAKSEFSERSEEHKEFFAPDTPLTTAAVRARAMLVLNTEALSNLLKIEDLFRDSSVLPSSTTASVILEYIRTHIEPQRTGTLQELLEYLQEIIKAGQEPIG